MTKKNLIAAAVLAASSLTANAGGFLTNTNQSIAFLRNPAREAAIGIDGVYSNPAGVALMPEGLHLGINWQMAVQKREVETTSPFLDQSLQNTMTKKYTGHASAPCIPSLGAAYNKGKWSYQFNFAVSGGGGKCEFPKGLGTFDNAVGQIATSLKPLGAMGYSANSYMEGRQYYFGVTLGAAYKLIDKEDMKLSVYGGLRGLIANASYEAQIKDIKVATTAGLVDIKSFITNNPQLAALVAKKAEVQGNIDNLQPIVAALPDVATLMAQAAGGDAKAQASLATLNIYQTATAGMAQIDGGIAQMNAGLTQAGQQLAPYANGIDLACDQSGFGIAPLFSVDFQYKRINLAAKYEFRTKMNLKNSSNLPEASIDATAQFVDGTKVREDSPALLTLGAQYSPIDIVRINAGYHHFYDRGSKKFANKQEFLSSGTNEYLGGVEVDVTDRLILSCGAQITKYGNTDAYMSDISFAPNSWSFGFGASYQANPNVKIEAAYFRTNYDHYKTATNAMGISNDFSRTNDVIGVGLVIDL